MSEWANRTLKDADVRVIKGEGLTSDKMVSGEIPVIAGGLSYCGMHNRANRNENCITVSASGANAGAVLFHKSKIFATDCSSIEWGGSQEFLYYALARRQKDFTSMQSGLAQPHVYPRDIEKIVLFYPTDTKEQSRIAAVLTAADEAIAASRALVEKYAAVKQGLMRDLLGKGERMKLERCLRICYGKDQKQIEVTDGIYPILGSGGEMGRTNTYLYNKPSVLIGRKGTIDNPLYIETPFWSIDTMYYTEIFNGYLPKYLYYVFTLIPWYKYNEASGVPSLSGSTIHKIEVNIPDLNEQIRIAEILTTADERLAAERERLMKLEDIKRGLMDDLLTNRVSTDKLQGGI